MALLLSPPCIAYLLFKEDTNRAVNFLVAVTTTLIFLPFGVSGLVAAIRTANSLGIIVAAADISIDAAYLTYSSPAIQNSDLREDLEWINTLAAIYGLARLSYALKDFKNVQLLKDIKTAISSLIKEGKLITGTGGGFKFLKEIESKLILCQEEPMSCAAACIRQLAKDNGIEKAESIIRDWAKTDFHTGTTLDNIKPAMEKTFEGKEIKAGTPYIGIDDMAKTAIKISDVTKGPWIATLKQTGTGVHHTIIVDKIERNIVYIRDPWNKTKGFGAEFGVEATMKLDDFVYYWKGSRYHHARIVK